MPYLLGEIGVEHGFRSSSRCRDAESSRGMRSVAASGAGEQAFRAYHATRAVCALRARRLVGDLLLLFVQAGWGQGKPQLSGRGCPAIDQMTDS
jgi:hypothetical protein